MSASSPAAPDAAAPDVAVPAATPDPLSGALPLAELDPAVRPQDDLWGHVNGRWLATDPIPADRGRWGLSDLKRARVSEQLREIVDSACATSDLAQERVVARLRDLLADEAGRATAGLDPVRDELGDVDAIDGLPDLLRVLGERQREGMTGVLATYLLPDTTDPTGWALHLFQAGLTLPVAPLYPRLGDALDEHARSLCAAAGLGPEVAASALDLERALAEVSWDAPEGEDDRALTHPMTFAELGDLAGVDLGPWLDALGLRPDRLGLDVCQPSYVAGLGRLLRAIPGAVAGLPALAGGRGTRGIPRSGPGGGARPLPRAGARGPGAADAGLAPPGADRAGPPAHGPRSAVGRAVCRRAVPGAHP